MRKNISRVTILLVIGLIGLSQAQVPSAKQRLVAIAGKQYRLTSKLKKILIGNFTYGFNHTIGAPNMISTLTRVFSDPSDSVTVDISTDGTDITAAKLAGYQVFFANDISSWASSTGFPTANRTAVQNFVEQQGGGLFIMHASGDSKVGGNWPWYYNVAHPVHYTGESSRTDVSAPIFIPAAAKTQPIMEGVGFGAGGLSDTFNVSQGEFAQFANIITDVVPNANVLLKMNGAQCKRSGSGTNCGIAFYNYLTPDGYPVSWTFPDLKGNIGYFMEGHDLVTMQNMGQPAWDKFFKQFMYWMAGYDTVLVASSPSGLSYPVPTAIYNVGTAIPNDTPSVAGIITSYSISPALPAGLTFDTSTGVISGIPTVPAQANTYSVTATNSFGTTTTQLSIAVQATQILKVLLVNQVGPNAYNHVSAIATASRVVQSLSSEKGFALVVSPSAAATQAKMTDDSLNTYQVIIFNNSAELGDLITTTNQRNAFQKWLKHGGGLVGWHALMDHADLWPWMTDSVFSGTKFTIHSSWGSPAGKTARVQVDTAATDGVIRSQKPEYSDLRAALPTVPWIWPDEWYSFRTNPRGKADVLLTIDESTYDVPTGGIMGPNHPVAWAYTLPADASGKQGRFIYVARGHDSAAYVGKGVNAAPNGVDSGATGLTRNFIWQSIRWAAGLTQGSITYSDSSFIYVVGSAVSLSPVLSGTLSGCTANPSLPTGLSIDSTSCVISGTTSATSAATSYAIKASNGSSFIQTHFTLTIASKSPANLRYASNPAIYGAGLTVSGNIPSVTGAPPFSYSVNPSLPNGLSLDTNTGKISGTTAIAQASANYTVKVRNAFDSTTTLLSIEVRNPITSFAYPSQNLTLGVNHIMTADTPSITGIEPFTPVRYSAAPTLPAGILLDSNTGIVSGTPVTAVMNNYVLTAKNGVSQFNKTDTLHILVLAVPSGLSYPKNLVTLVKDSSSAPDSPFVTGMQLRYSVNPALPAGLKIDSLTGVISGTPTLATGAQNYTITATNIAGSTTATVNITVRLPPTALLSRTQNTFVFRTGGTSVTFRPPSTAASADISIKDMWGRTKWNSQIRSLNDPGPHELFWDGITSNGRALSAGLYFVNVRFYDATNLSMGSIQKRLSLIP